MKRWRTNEGNVLAEQPGGAFLHFDADGRLLGRWTSREDSVEDELYVTRYEIRGTALMELVTIRQAFRPDVDHERVVLAQLVPLDLEQAPTPSQTAEFMARAREAEARAQAKIREDALALAAVHPEMDEAEERQRRRLATRVVLHGDRHARAMLELMDYVHECAPTTTSRPVMDDLVAASAFLTFDRQERDASTPRHAALGRDESPSSEVGDFDEWIARVRQTSEKTPRSAAQATEALRLELLRAADIRTYVDDKYAEDAYLKAATWL